MKTAISLALLFFLCPFTTHAMLSTPAKDDKTKRQCTSNTIVVGEYNSAQKRKVTKKQRVQERTKARDAKYRSTDDK